jgi:formylglycine-generating enzyme required for sulfatase activity
MKKLICLFFVLSAVLLGSGCSSSRTLSGNYFKDCEVCPEMTVVNEGTFSMGTLASEQKSEDRERPRHDVTIDRPFAIGIFEVTFNEWQACLAGDGCNNYLPFDEGWGQKERPVIHVNWHDANAYVQWLSKITGEHYRLPSEAEWEFAARSGTTTAYSFGNDENELCAFANAADLSLNAGSEDGYLPLDCDDGYGAKTSPVGSFKPNAFGLYDVHGNVWEWVADCWNESYIGAPEDGTAWKEGDCGLRVLRSASWVDARGGSLRSGHRGRIDVSMRSNNLGFRVVRTMAP